MTDSETQIPSREHLCKLQMLRTTLVRLLSLGDQLDEVCNGCLVRVLLEIKGGDVVETSSNDYHVAVLRGIKRGMAYSGFTWDHIQTDIHFVIELPPVVRTTPHGNHVQLNSISNSPIRDSEYTLWVQQMVSSRALIITPSQVDLRVMLLEQQMRTFGVSNALKPKRRRPVNAKQQDPATKQQQKERFEAIKNKFTEEYNTKYTLFPSAKDLPKKGREEILLIESKLLQTLEGVRLAIKEKSKCRICKKEQCAVICYPCKHQVMCTSCSANVTNCPAPNCGANIEEKITPFVV
eukprot:PhF_6_TR12951/c0_g1_i1/m.20440